MKCWSCCSFSKWRLSEPRGSVVTACVTATFKSPSLSPRGSLQIKLIPSNKTQLSHGKRTCVMKRTLHIIGRTHTKRDRNGDLRMSTRMPKAQPVGTHEASPKPRGLKAARSQETMRRGCLAPSASAHRRAARAVHAQCVSLGQGQCKVHAASLHARRAPTAQGLTPSARRSR